MRVPRVYHNNKLDNLETVSLNQDESHHLINVLRLKVGDSVELFDNTNYVYSAIITAIDKKKVIVKLNKGLLQDKESNLYLHLAQVISRGEKMEFTIQKAVELGVNQITPLYSERCGVKFDNNRMQKKLMQWEKIIIGACKQSGRNKLPILNPIINLEDWVMQHQSGLKLTLSPNATTNINQLNQKNKDINKITLVIGSEGGFSDKEIKLMQQHKFIDISLGKRILRTETAGLVALSILQALWGDLS